MEKLRRFVVVMVLAVIGLVSVGCVSSSSRSAEEDPYAQAAWQYGPLVDAQGHYRSLALDSAWMNELAAANDARYTLPEGPAWYEGRLDRVPRVAAGSRSQVTVYSQTRTRDRFSSSDGDVKDNYSQRTSREKIIQIVR